MRLYCGIDLHSNNSVVSVIDDEDRVHYEKRLANDLAVIEAALMPYREALAGVVVESTYNGYWLVDGLQASGFDVRLGNTVAMKQYSGLKYTNDQTDARFLGRLLRLGILPEGYIYPRAKRGVRDLFRRRLLLVGQRTAQQMSLQSLFARQRGERIKAAEVKGLDVSQFSELFGDDAVGLAAHTAVAVMASLSHHIDEIERYVRGQCRDRAHYRLLTSVPGIGVILGQTIALETGAIERFPKVGNYASYARCVKTERLSNAKRKGQGNVKNGNRYLAMAFMEAAHYAAIWDPTMKRFYQRKRARSPVMVAKKALANKLARAVYHMLKHQQPFDIARAFG